MLLQVTPERGMHVFYDRLPPEAIEGQNPENIDSPATSDPIATRKPKKKIFLLTFLIIGVIAIILAFGLKFGLKERKQHDVGATNPLLSPSTTSAFFSVCFRILLLCRL